MKEWNSKYSSSLECVFKVLVFIYFMLSFCYTLFLAEGGGDESLFLNDFLFIETNGWIAAIEKSISIPYMILVYPFSFFFDGYFLLKLPNVLLLLLLLLYFFKVVKIKNTTFYFYLFFYLATSRYFFSGTNDALFFTGLVLFITEVFYFIENKKMNSSILAFSGLIISFFTRELFILYFPVVLLGFFILFQNGYVFLTKKMLFPLVLFLFLLLFNSPSLLKKGSLSYDDKTPSSTIKASWRQRQYLAQLLVNKGEIPNFSHPSWEETQDYLKINGSDSLPDGILDAITFDYSMTIKEFFKDFYYSMFFGLRQLGLVMLFPFYFLIVNLRKTSILNPMFFVPYSFVLILSIFSLIVISYIEPRWYISIFIVAIVFYNHYQLQEKINYKFILVNYLIFICFSMYGIYGILHKHMHLF
jgi:hypothetical protein